MFIKRIHENYMKTDRHHDSQSTGCCVTMLVWIDGALFEGNMIALKKEKDTLSLHCIYLNVLIFLSQTLDKKLSEVWASTKSFSLGPQVWHGITDVTTDRQVVQYRLPTTRLQTNTALLWTRSLVWSGNLLRAATDIQFYGCNCWSEV